MCFHLPGNLQHSLPALNLVAVNTAVGASFRDLNVTDTIRNSFGLNFDEAFAFGGVD